jgi:prophage regulatory protein
VSKRILRIKDVERLVGLKRSRIRQLMDKGQFPSSFNLAERAKGWLEMEVEIWIEERAAKRHVIWVPAKE